MRLLEMQIRELMMTKNRGPDPDDSISSAKTQLLEAEQAHHKVLQRFVDFTAKGIVPRDYGI